MTQSSKKLGVTALVVDPPIVLDAATPTREAVQRMKRERTGHVLVTEKDRLSGIFTERDVLEKVLGSPQALDQPVSEWMTRDPVRVEAADPLFKAAFHMHEGLR